jgi:hypothetical protein
MPDPVQRHAIVAGGGDAQALGSEGDAFDRAVLRKLFGRAVGQPHQCALAVGIGDRTLRAGSNLPDPFARGFCQNRHAAIGRDAQHLAVLAAGNQALAMGIANAGEHALMGFRHLVSAFEAMDRAGGAGEEGGVT